MFEKLTICPVCSNDSFTNHIICKDHFLTGESFAIARCNHCHFLFTNPRPDENSISRYYNSEAYISHTSKSKSPVDLIYLFARYFTLSRKLKLINSISDNKTILDVGCGTGDFLAKCKSNGWQTFGIEPNPAAREIAISKTSDHIYSNLDQSDEINNIDVITLWHVLEHIHTINETLTILISKLSKKGKIVIAVPNYHSYDARLYKEFWAAYDIPRHLYHFSQDTMKLLLKKHGLKIFDTLPMKLDSFYVTLLSEKYKYGKTNYLNSIINGYKSNSYAKKHQKNYSSLIFISGK